MLRLEAVSKRYGKDKLVLHNVDLELSAAEVVAITGGNGTGKSTLLRLLVGLSRPTTGSVSGRPAVIGYVPDRFPSHERLSAMEYLTHLGRIRGLGTSVAYLRAVQLMDRLSLQGEKHSQLRTLSKGNVQKVALAQALLVQPQLLVLDEPWSGLDASAHGVLADIIAETARAGGLVVFTDHHESIIEAHASRTYTISAGQVSRRGPVNSGSMVEVVLAQQSASDGPREVNWHALAGVLDVTRRAGTVTVRVVPDRSDAVLLTALQHGWSVKGLGPLARGAIVNRSS